MDFAIIDVIGYLVEVREEAPQDDDDNGGLSLHLEADEAPLEVGQLLVDKCPQTLKAKDGNSKLPIHIAVKAGKWTFVAKSRERSGQSRRGPSLPASGRWR